MSEPALIVRVMANLEGLRKGMTEANGVIITTQHEMSKIAGAFDGSRIIAQSGAVMAGIQALGGVTNLTSAEQRKANSVLQEAIDKYAALGREAPPGMQALADATKNAHTAQSDLLGLDPIPWTV